MTCNMLFSSNIFITFYSYPCKQTLLYLLCTYLSSLICVHYISKHFKRIMIIHFSGGFILSFNSVIYVDVCIYIYIFTSIHLSFIKSWFGYILQFWCIMTRNVYITCNFIFISFFLPTFFFPLNFLDPHMIYIMLSIISLFSIFILAENDHE